MSKSNDNVSSSASSSSSSSVEIIINLKILTIVGALLPCVGCYLCIVYTYLFEFHRVQQSIIPVCPGTENVLTPISYIIGIWEPTRTIWFCVMFINFPARLLIPINDTIYATCWWYKFLNQFHMLTLFLEPVALVVITIFNVDSSFYIHAVAFGVWLVTICLNMFTSSILCYFSGNTKNPDYPIWLFYLKLALCGTAILLSLSMSYTYPYAVSKCHQPTYVFFSITEYTLVLINSLFYCLIYWDCSNVSLRLTGN